MAKVIHRAQSSPVLFNLKLNIYPADREAKVGIPGESYDGSRMRWEMPENVQSHHISDPANQVRSFYM